MSKTDRQYAEAGNTMELVAAIESFAGQRVLIFGDVMLDEYLSGAAERISPEAPVPVVRIEHESQLAGGAGNVARNIKNLGGEPLLIGARGHDRPGADLEACLSAENITTRFLNLEDRPTTIKTRVMARQQQVLRIDREHTAPLSSAQVRLLAGMVEEELTTSKALVVSDYGKGLVCRQSMNAILASARRKGIPVLVDPKPGNFRLYKGVGVLTPNAKETGESVNLPVRTPKEIIRAGRAIMQRLGCEHLVTTLGSRGMAVFESKTNIRHIPTTARQVFDVTGAGDTVISSLALGAAAGLPLIHSCLLANYAAGIVVGKVGAATVTPNELAEAVATLPRPELHSWAADAGSAQPNSLP
ncbi:D-glycero-beta-D-manno-heptose-7-phosphate kinase [Desulfovibrio sp. OttesenSCG-928-F20]|nr:D-glycero-beta-D-manno-heptose-7-phosphate kinase [Desulfovibrio sp. OttesenSCG-928-F20]